MWKNNARWLPVGIALVLTGFVVGIVSDARQRARIHYALTSKRVIVAGRAWRARVQSINLSSLFELSLTEWRNGRGTVSFRGELNDTVTLGVEKNIVPLEFGAIADPRRVFEMIRDAQKRVLAQQPGGSPAGANAVEVDRVPAAIGAYLSAGEQVLWLGQPWRGLMLRATDALMVPLTLLVAMVGGFLCWYWFGSWIAGTLHTEKSGFWFINGLFILLVLLMFYIVVGRFFTDAWQRTKTHYALTGERVLIARGSRRGGIQSVNLRTLSDLSLTEGKDGYGTVWLTPMPSSGASGDVLGINMSPRLDTIPDAQRVYQMIRDAQRRLT